jgi:hypothetical protein
LRQTVKIPSSLHKLGNISMVYFLKISIVLSLLYAEKAAMNAQFFARF